MTAIRREAMEMLERIPEDKLSYVLQIMRGVDGLIGETEKKEKHQINLEQFIMNRTERGVNADEYIRGMRNADRF